MSNNLAPVAHGAFAIWIAAAAVPHASVMHAQTLNWLAAGSPSARCCMFMGYDPATHSTVLFGGSNNDKQYLGDTWTWRGGWRAMLPANSPSARIGGALAYDGAGNMVLFGGYSSTGIYFNDTWTWDGNNWTQQFPPTSPSPRSTYLARDPANGTLVLFGGSSSSGVLGDTWTWDPSAKTWTQQNPAASPSPRSAPFAFDVATKTVLLFGGGGNDSVCFTDTWTWNGASWTQHFPAAAPSPRTGAVMTYDYSTGAVVLFGGAANNVWEDSLNDTWTWNGFNWTQIHPATTPPNRYAFGMDYDPIENVVLMFGGYSSGPARGDTWLLELAH